MTNYRTIFVAPAICFALLFGMVAESASRVTPTDAEPYHRRAREAIESIPSHIGSWSARKQSIPREAITILRPNAIKCWTYIDGDTSSPGGYDRWASLLVDQCKEARDMSGHYPPNCYCNSGEKLTYTAARSWPVKGMTIAGTEYHFQQTTANEGSTRTAVYSFLIVPGPGAGIYPDIKGVDRAAEDYQRRFFGAAQFQLVMDADLRQSERDEIFTTLMEPCVPVIKTLMSGGNLNGQ